MKNVELLVYFRPLEEPRAALGWLHGLFSCFRLHSCCCSSHWPYSWWWALPNQQPLGNPPPLTKTAAERSSTKITRAPLRARIPLQRDLPCAERSLISSFIYLFGGGLLPSALSCCETAASPLSPVCGSSAGPQPSARLRWATPPPCAAAGSEWRPARSCERGPRCGGGDPISSLAPSCVHLLYPGRRGRVAGVRSEARQQEQPHSGISFLPPQRGAVPRSTPARPRASSPAAGTGAASRNPLSAAGAHLHRPCPDCGLCVRWWRSCSVCRAPRGQRARWLSGRAKAKENSSLGYSRQSNQPGREHLPGTGHPQPHHLLSEEFLP